MIHFKSSSSGSVSKRESENAPIQSLNRREKRRLLSFFLIGGGWLIILLDIQVMYSIFSSDSLICSGVSLE